MTSLRRILKTIINYPVSSLMTVGSLIISFSGIIILVLYVSFEKSFDRYNKNYQTVYRLETQLYGSNIPAPMGVETEKNIPSVEALTTLTFMEHKVSTPALDASNISYSSGMIYCDSNLFEIFTLPVLLGDKSNIPGEVNMGWTREVDGKFIEIQSWPVDANFLDFFGLTITQGRKFEKTSQADENSFILNEKAVSQFGWNSPLERRINGWGTEAPVIGVMKDFNFSSLKEEIKPMMLWYTNKFSSRILLLKIRALNIPQTIDFIKKTAQSIDPKNKVDVRFLDEALNKMYEKERKTARFIEFSALWCVLLGVAGLLGLIVFVCKARKKEIGIRKVNGAKVIEVMALLNKDLLKLMFIAFIVSTPFSWLIMHRWLGSIAYKTNMSWWISVLAGIMTLGIALLTVSWHGWRSAVRRKPAYQSG